MREIVFKCFGLRLGKAARVALFYDMTVKDYFGTGLGIAVRQGNTELQQKLNTALEKVKKDGTYETIYNKWFQK